MGWITRRVLPALLVTQQLLLLPLLQIRRLKSMGKNETVMTDVEGGVRELTLRIEGDAGVVAGLRVRGLRGLGIGLGGSRRLREEFLLKYEVREKKSAARTRRNGRGWERGREGESETNER